MLHLCGQSLPPIILLFDFIPELLFSGNSIYSQRRTPVSMNCFVLLTLSMACHHCLVFLSLFVELAIFSTGQIPIGSQLSASQNQVWLSENSTFAFGFTSSGSDGQFLLAIWYSKLPGDPTVTWSPNRESPVGRDAVVKLDLTGNLVLLNGSSSLWMSNTSHQGVKYALMSEFGSFILYNGSSNDSQIAWQSFWHPSDTLLPGQQLTGSLELSSVKSSLGYYSLKMLQQRTSLSLALTYVSLESSGASPEYYANYSYWSSPEISNATGDVVAVLDQSGNFGIMYGSSSSGTMYVHKNDSGGNSSPRRITIGIDGNLRLYRWDASWVTEWSALSNPCMAAGVCGSGVCTLDSSKTNSSCTCLQENSSASAGDKACSSSASKPSPVKCSENHGIGVTMETVAQTNYYFSGASTIKNYSNVMVASQCADYCLSDCDCVAALYGLEEDKPDCWTLKSLVFGGFQDPSATLYMKVGADGSQAGGSSSGHSSSSKGAQAVVLPLVLCTSVLIVLFSFLLCYSIRRRRIVRQQEISSSLSFPGAPVYFSYNVLQSATGNFSRLIGTGGFGSVYKGTLRDGTLIAVKKLERMLPHGEKEFITEVTTIGSMHHMNLVSLCGFCSEGSHRLLVYEYMSNGSLDKWIFPSYEQQDKLLDWKTRFNIAIAIAEGIAYFHEQCRNRVIHCDIKPENILLDDDLCPKVSDFGLAKLMNRGHSEVITMVRGTRGYLAPEWISSRPITVKADVYSYGMLLLEIIGGRRNLDMSLDAEDYYYPGWAFKEMTNGTPLHAADRRLEGRVDEEEMVRALKCAFWCIQEEAWSRPSMGEVVRMLEGSVEINEPPMPQAILELMDEGLENIYKAMKRDFFSYPITSSSLITSHLASSRATCSYSTMSPR